jgi:hypothetical protein
MRPTTLLAALLLGALASCASLQGTPKMPPTLARTRATPDFASYPLQRVGLLPLASEVRDELRLRELQQSLAFELARTAPFEIVALSEADLAEVTEQSAHQRGTYSPNAILTAARRFRLDGLLVGTVTHLETYAPLTLGVKLELVPVETGLPIWVADLDLDTSEARVRESIDIYQARRLDAGGAADDSAVLLLSPRSFLRFAAGEVARTFEPR